MRSGTIALAFLGLLATSMQASAGPPGGGHRAPSAAGVPQFNPANTARFNQLNMGRSPQGAFDQSYWPQYTASRRASSSRTKLKSQPSANTKATSNTSPNSLGALTQTSAGNASAPVGAKPSTVASSGAGTATTAGTTANAGVGGGAISNPVAGSGATTALTGMTVGTATGATTGTATTSSVATGALTPSGAALMSHLYGGNGNSGYGGYSSRRAYGSGYGSRYYGNGNNSQYFAQMRRLSQLVNALNNLTVGSTVSQLQTSRVHSGLVGVVFGNARPPSQPVYQLAKHLASTLPNRKIPMMNTGQLARDLAVVMNGRGHNTSQIHQAIGSAESIMNQSGVAGPGIQAIASDLRMVASAGNLMNGMARIP